MLVDRDTPLRLHYNENAYGPSPRVRAAVIRAAHESIHLYPDITALRHDLARMWGVGDEQVTLGAGGDEILRRAVDVTAGAVVSPWPSFSVYPVLARARGRVFDRVALDPAGAADPGALVDAANRQTRPGTVLLANPNNPTGAARVREDFLAMARRLPGWLVVIDEAYAEFRDEVEPSAGVDTWPENVIVARTMSKLHAVAGMRVGYAVGRGWAVEAVHRIGDEMSVSSLSLAAARAAIADTVRLDRVRSAVRGRRAQLTAGLERRGFSVRPSQTNFVLAAPPAGVDVDRLHADLRAAGVWIRRGVDLGVPGTLRVSVGSGPQHRAFFAFLDERLAAAGVGVGAAAP